MKSDGCISLRRPLPASRPKLGRFGSNRGAQLLEMALALPLLLILAVGILDFGTAYNLKQILNNAAREGARLGSGAPNIDAKSGTGCAAGTTTQTVHDDIVTYLANAKVDTSFIPSSGAWSAPATCSYYCGTTACGGAGSTTYGLIIERSVLVPSGGTNIVSTRVTIVYPYSWLYNFARMVSFLVPGTAAPPGTVPISTNAVMANLN